MSYQNPWIVSVTPPTTTYSSNNITFDDSIANLWVSNISEAIQLLDAKTDQIDAVWATNYTSYVNNLI